MNDLTPNAIVLHRDFYDVLQKLDDKQRGRLLLALYEYAFDDEVTTELDAITNIAYSVIARTIDMNTKRYQEISEKRRQAALRGGAPIGNKNAAKKTIKNNQKQPKQPNGCNQNNLPQKPKQPKQPKTTKTTQIQIQIQIQIIKIRLSPYKKRRRRLFLFKQKK